MSKEKDLARIERTGIIAILRASSPDQLTDVAEALLAGGVEAIEVTFTVPRATSVLEQVTHRLGERVLLGAGTVLDAETARIALLSGAQFIVAPNTNPEVIQLCRRYDKLVMPGAFTPTEVVQAWELGADVVKIFPSDVVGPAYLKALKGPLPQVRLMPTGGVTLNTAGAFLQAGAYALGVGTALLDTQALAKGDMQRIESLAREFVALVSGQRKRD